MTEPLPAHPVATLARGGDCRPDVSTVCLHVTYQMGGAAKSVVRLFLSRLVRSSGPLAGLDWASESDTTSVKQALLVFESQALQCVFDPVFS